MECEGWKSTLEIRDPVPHCGRREECRAEVGMGPEISSYPTRSSESEFSLSPVLFQDHSLWATTALVLAKDYFADYEDSKRKQNHAGNLFPLSSLSLSCFPTLRSLCGSSLLPLWAIFILENPVLSRHTGSSISQCLWNLPATPSHAF